MKPRRSLSRCVKRSPYRHVGTALALAVTCVAPTVQAQAVSGVAFLDENGNGRPDAGEPGVAGVVVSNQVDAVETDAAGRYRLERIDGFPVLFAAPPSEYAVTRPFWRTVANDAAANAVDFPLRRIEIAGAFTFIHASDTHVSETSVERMRLLRAIVQERQPAFVIVTGDLVRDALRVQEGEARRLYDMYVREIDQFPAPVWSVPGNHEIFGIERHLSLVSPEHPLYGKRMYRHFLGPTYYSFNYGGIHFVGLDTADFEDLWYYGHVDATQLAWLQRDLSFVARGSPVVTFNHIPFISAALASGGFRDTGPAPTLIEIEGQPVFRHVVSNYQDVRNRLADYDHTLALGGHFHHREVVVREGDPTRFHLTGAVVGPSGPFPSGVVLYRVRDGKIDDGEFIRLDAGDRTGTP